MTVLASSNEIFGGITLALVFLVIPGCIIASILILRASNKTEKAARALAETAGLFQENPSNNLRITRGEITSPSDFSRSVGPYAPEDSGELMLPTSAFDDTPDSVFDIEEFPDVNLTPIQNPDTKS